MFEVSKEKKPIENFLKVKKNGNQPMKIKPYPLGKIRKDFPLLEKNINKCPLIYFDSAATTLKPRSVVQVMNDFYLNEVSNVHRGSHYLSDRATDKFEKARENIRSFIGARESEEVIFTKGTTESVHIVASSYVGSFLKPKDEILLTEMEHHSNIIPWQMIAKKKNLNLKVIPVLENGELDFETFLSLLSEKTSFVSLTWVSNVLGTVNPIQKYVEASHKVGAKVFIDAAQSVGVLKTDVQKIDCDFLAFSGHKVFGPFGIGVLYGKKELLENMPPYQGGGGSIDSVTFKKTEFLGPPHRFEAGTPPIAEVIGLSQALDYISEIGLKEIYEHEKSLMEKLTESLREVFDLIFIGSSPTKVNISSFILKGLHSSDVGQILNQRGVAIRTGHHCAQPLMDRYKLSLGGTLRLSLSIYNTEEELHYFKDALLKTRELIKGDLS